MNRKPCSDHGFLESEGDDRNRTGATYRSSLTQETPANSGSLSARENLAWIESRAAFAVAQHHVLKHPQLAEETLTEIAERARLALAALDAADRSLNEFSAMAGSA